MTILKAFFLAAAIGLVAQPKPVLADTVSCQIYAIENTSASGQRRERVFVAIAENAPDVATALGYSVASSKVMSKGLDYVDVFVTRRLDGTNRADHSAGTALAWIRFNPGRTPVMTQKMVAKVVVSEVGDLGELAVLLMPKRDLVAAEVMDAYLDNK